MPEMKPDKKQKEIKKLLTFIYFEWNKEITPELVMFWLDGIKGMDLKDAWDTAKFLREKKPFGEPKIGDFLECYRQLTAPPKIFNPWIDAREPEPDYEVESFRARQQLKPLEGVAKELVQMATPKKLGMN